MKDIILDTLIDALKLVPFLFLVFLLMELLEHKYGEKSEEIIKKSKKFGPILGGLLGAVPQCGFSVAATNLYVTRIISLGTLISVYLSTSDEMLPIFLSNNVELKFILYVILIKVVIGMIMGIFIDLIIRKKQDTHIHDFCDEEHCDCEHGILKSTIKHTLNILLFIVLVELVFNTAIHYLGEDNISKLLMNHSAFGSFITSLLGLIPNCASSVIITELYINKAISFGSMIGGLLTGSGVALLVLFKENKNIKENLSILLLIYSIGAISGLIINLIGLI